MSASTTPTLRPSAAIAAARLTVTDDLPTPPLPEATAYTRVSEPGLAKGTSRSAVPPRRAFASSLRCSSLMTSRVTSTRVTPSTRETASVTRWVIVSRIGQPETVRYTVTATAPSAPISTDLTIPSSVMGRLISGSFTVASASRTASSVAIGRWYGAVAMPG